MATATATSQSDDFNAGTTWRPDQEHPRIITGELVDARSVIGTYGPYPLLELQQDDGLVWHVHAFRDVLQSELANCDPQPGDKITISYGGKSDKGYYLYRVGHVDGRRNRVNWAQFTDSTPAVDDDLPVEPVDDPKPPDRLEREHGEDHLPPW